MGEDFLDGKLPSLDTKVWVVDNWRLMFEFFEKTMATNLMVEAGSALSTEIKMTTLSEEVTRRLRNTSMEMESSRRLELIENACIKMKTSGHKDTFIRLAVEKGIRAYNERVSRSKLEEDHPGFQPLYPKAGWKKDLRSKEKALKRGNWFKGKDDKTETFLHETGGGVKKKPFLKAGWKNKLRKSAATVVFVPSTRGGTLVRMLMEDEDKMAEMSGFRVKYQEAGGSILANAFEKDLGSGQHCGRAACPPCQIPGERGNYKNKNVVYESCC